MHMNELYGTRLSRKDAYQLYVSVGTVEEFEYLPSPLTETEQALYDLCHMRKEKLVPEQTSVEQLATETKTDDTEVPSATAGSQG